ncbi:MAG TPA: hypothetical protein VNJ09_04375 [Chthonomonadales bacterium]|nr:hypothetical protein [Chthonomonadales bacterium]
MKKFLVWGLAALVLMGATTVSRAAILFDYTVQVDGFGPFVPVDYSQSSGAAGTLEVTGLAGANFDAEGLGTDVDIATVLAFQTPSSSTFSVFDGSTSSYTFTITVFDLASGLSGNFTVTGFLSGQFRELPGAQYALGNTYIIPPGGAGSGPIQIGNFWYKLDFPVFGQDFDSPAPDGRWTFNIHAAVPEPGALAMLVGAAVCGSMFIPYRLRRNRRS